MKKTIRVIRKWAEKMDSVYVIDGVYSTGKQQTYTFDIEIDGEFYLHIPAESGFVMREIPNALVQGLEITLIKEKIKVYSDWTDKHTSMHSLSITEKREDWINLDHSKGGWEYPYDQDDLSFTIESPEELDADKWYTPVDKCTTTEIFGDFKDSHTISIQDIKIINHFKL